MKKTILHISRMNFLSNKAHVYTTTKTCEAFVMKSEINVILLSSDNSLADEKSKIDFFKKHSVINKFEIVSLHSISNSFKGSNSRLINWLETLTANISIFLYVIANSKRFDILYFRDCSLFLPILVTKYILNKPIFLELHAILHKKHGQILNDFFSKISDGLIAISYGLKEYYEKINSRIIVAFCAAAEHNRFEAIEESKELLRDEFCFKKDEIILMYSGNLSKTGNNDSYGIEDIIRVMPYLDENFIFVCVGKKGNETVDHEVLARYLGVEKRVVFLPWKDKQEVYRYWKASDILILPSAGAQVGNSPTKMFEYLASGKVIVSAKTRAIEEVLVDGVNAKLVSDYKDPTEWASVIKNIVSNKDLSNKLIKNAMIESYKYTWKARGSLIVDFITGIQKQKK